MAKSQEDVSIEDPTALAKFGLLLEDPRSLERTRNGALTLSL